MKISLTLITFISLIQFASSQQLISNEVKLKPYNLFCIGEDSENKYFIEKNIYNFYEGHHSYHTLSFSDASVEEIEDFPEAFPGAISALLECILKDNHLYEFYGVSKEITYGDDVDLYLVKRKIHDLSIVGEPKLVSSQHNYNDVIPQFYSDNSGLIIMRSFGRSNHTGPYFKRYDLDLNEVYDLDITKHIVGGLGKVRNEIEVIDTLTNNFILGRFEVRVYDVYSKYKSRKSEKKNLFKPRPLAPPKLNVIKENGDKIKLNLEMPSYDDYRSFNFFVTPQNTYKGVFEWSGSNSNNSNEVVDNNQVSIVEWNKKTGEIIKENSFQYKYEDIFSNEELLKFSELGLTNSIDISGYIPRFKLPPTVKMLNDGSVVLYYESLAALEGGDNFSSDLNKQIENTGVLMKFNSDCELLFSKVHEKSIPEIFEIELINSNEIAIVSASPGDELTSSFGNSEVGQAIYKLETFNLKNGELLKGGNFANHSIRNILNSEISGYNKSTKQFIVAIERLPIVGISGGKIKILIDILDL